MVSPAPIPQPLILSHTGFSETVAAERDWLVRWFMLRCGGQSMLAEDLAQETLIEAWRIRERFTAGDRGTRPWLAAIARNVLLRWQRASGTNRSDPLAPEIADSLPADDSLDPVWFSEQDELRDVLDRALATIPSAARDLLVRRYMREESIAEIALTEHQTAAHVGVRLQRARNAVRKAIDDLFPEDFVEDLVTISPTITTPSRLWCPGCGSAKLIKTIWRDGSSYHLRCPQCDATPDSYMLGWFRASGCFDTRILGDNAVLTPTMSARELIDHTFGAVWAVMHRDEQVRCPHCDKPVYSRLLGADAPDRLATQVEYWCHACGPLHQSGSLCSAAMNHPRGTAFWREEGQIRTGLIQKTTISGHDAILVTLSAIQRTASITFGYTADATRLLLIDE